MPTIDQYRSDLDELARLATLDLDVLWRQVTDGDVAYELLADILPDLVDVYGSAAGTVSADWYDDLRDELDQPGRFRALTANLPERPQVDALARWSVADLTPDTDLAGPLTRAQGGLQRLITDVGRNTIIGSSVSDPHADGWQRSASGGCGFCRMLASRGAVYSSDTVNFGAHDHCRCVAVPAFGGHPKPVAEFFPTSRTVTDADRARTREWMRENGY